MYNCINRIFEAISRFNFINEFFPEQAKRRSGYKSKVGLGAPGSKELKLSSK